MSAPKRAPGLWDFDRDLKPFPIDEEAEVFYLANRDRQNWVQGYRFYLFDKDDPEGQEK